MRVCATCPVQPQCLDYVFTGVAARYKRQHGVFAGIPGRMRERLCYEPCGHCGGRGYLRSIELDGRIVAFKHYASLYAESALGFTCQDCKGHGVTLRADRKERAMAWFTEMARAHRWIVDTKERVSA
jgi:hypothetical protein